MYDGPKRRKKGARVARLILSTFRREPKPGEEARHLDDVPTNNRLSNLAWGTSLQNKADARKNGLTCRGEKNPKAKLCRADVIAILKRVAAGEQQKIIAEDFGVTYWSVYRIVQGKSWTHLFS
jgi:hypothetical protein